MKKTFKGFTLIECIVALAILGIASLVMAQIYANVSRINRSNHMINTSLSYQMKYVEEKNNAEATKITYGGTLGTNAPHNNAGAGGNNNYIAITSNAYKADGTQITSFTSTKYSYAVDMYVLLSRDTQNRDSGDAGFIGTNEDYKLNYRYMLGH